MNCAAFIHQVTIEFRFQKSLAQKRFKDICGYYICAHFLASGNNKVGLRHVFRPVYELGSILISDIHISDRCSDVILTK